jgi:hypothetical protein
MPKFPVTVRYITPQERARNAIYALALIMADNDPSRIIILTDGSMIVANNQRAVQTFVEQRSHRLRNGDFLKDGK